MIGENHGRYSANDAEWVTLVDEAGVAIGEAGRIEAHRGAGLLHRALTCLVFNEENALLMARRAADKPLWPAFWDGTVATHQRRDEADEAAVVRRVPEELGTAVSDVRSLGRIVYHAQWDESWAEQEVCSVLAARATGTPSPMPGEIDELSWIRLDDLEQFTSSHDTAPWFFLAWDEIQGGYRDEFDDWLQGMSG